MQTLLKVKGDFIHIRLSYMKIVIYIYMNKENKEHPKQIGICIYLTFPPRNVLIPKAGQIFISDTQSYSAWCYDLTVQYANESCQLPLGTSLQLMSIYKWQTCLHFLSYFYIVPALG